MGMELSSVRVTENHITDPGSKEFWYLLTAQLRLQFHNTDH